MPVTSDSARCRDKHVQISTKSGFDSVAWAVGLEIENLESGIWNAAEALALMGVVGSSAEGFTAEPAAL
ncbi:MAG: hypothetical protein ACP5QA_15545 [Phycisphaerae bacterium]